MSERTTSTLAIALQYEKPNAPRVTAKGHGPVGQMILDTAREHGVPIEENAALAEALSTVELGDQIPEHLYRAVVEVLIFVLQLSGKLR